MAEETEETLFARLLQTTNTLSSKPWQALAPYEEQIASLSEHFNSLTAKLVRGTALPNLEPGVSGISQINPSRAFIPTETENPAAAILPQKLGTSLKPTATVHRLIIAAHTQFLSAQARIQHLKRDTTFNWLAQDARFLHLNSISSLRQHRKTRNLGVCERLLLVCSCMSLATDFRNFERSNGWQAKEDVLVLSLTQGLTPAVQKISKHTKSFFDALEIPRDEEQKLDAGLRLGTKLNVAERLGESLGFGSIWPLVLGFELSRLSRMPYGGFLNTSPEAGDHSKLSSDCLRHLAKAYGTWWESCKTEYAVRFSNVDWQCPVVEAENSGSVGLSPNPGNALLTRQTTLEDTSLVSPQSTPVENPTSSEAGLPFISDLEGTNSFWFDGDTTNTEPGFFFDVDLAMLADSNDIAMS